VPPIVPADLLPHQRIRARMGTGKLYRSEFEKHGQVVLSDRLCWRIGNRLIPVCRSISPMAAYPRPATRPARLRALIDLIREPAPAAA